MSFTPVLSLVGGALIGLSASLLLVVDGRVAGISSILGGTVLPRRGDVAWRAAFLAGLCLGGALLLWRLPEALASPPAESPAVLAIAGLLVGVGTQLGGGCTSGHGVCGLSRLSWRSLVAVVTFMTTGVVAAYVTRHVLPRLG